MRRTGKKWLFGTLMLALCFGYIQGAAAEKLKVAFFNPQTENDTFWKPVTEFMQAACEDLGMELDVYVADFNYPRMLRQVRKAVNSPDKPDFLVFKNFRQQAPKILEAAERAEVPAFLFNAGLLPENTKRYGKPREHFTYWIGQMIPDDERAGYDLAKILFEGARKKSLTDSDGNIQAVGMSGPVADTPAILRNEGFRRAAAEEPDVFVHQIIATEWQRAEARGKFPRLIKRYPDSTVAWAANDPISLGIVDAMNAMGKTPGQDIVTGGIDWTPGALDAVKRGEMTATIGGHFMEGGWVMVLLYDYAHGIDFAAESVSMTSRMSALTQENLDAYLTHFGDQDWSKIDFTAFSKQEHPELERYHFGIDAILQQFP